MLSEKVRILSIYQAIPLSIHILGGLLVKFKKINPENTYFDVTIVVNSCDSYSDVLPLFNCALEEYWSDRNFPVVINCESNPILNYSDIDKDSVSWGERFKDILCLIKTKYVIILFDDFILESKVDNSKIESAISVLEADINSSVFYLNAACVASHIDDPSEDYRKLKDDVDYRLNSVPSVWKRQDLINFTSVKDNPWSWEVFGSYRTFYKKNFYSVSSQKNNIFNYNYKKGGAIYRGQWVKDVVVPKIDKYGLKIDLKLRGFCNAEDKIQRTLAWKLNFLLIGWQSVNFKVFKFLFRSLFKKIKVKSSV